MGQKPDDNPFASPQASPRFATPLAILGFVLAFVTLLTGLAPLIGPTGMAVGLIAHLKGSRLGLPATFASAAALILAMAFGMYLR